MTKSNRKLIDLTGQTFGRLTVLRDTRIRTKDRPNGRRGWVCLCKCGSEITVMHGDLVAGHTRSCGCLERDMLIARNQSRKPNPESLSNLPEHGVWKGIKKRCQNPKYRQFHLYGGRGICLCNGWSEFRIFLAAVGKRPSDAHTIERVDNNGNYSCGTCEQCLENEWPMNVRWATRLEQAQNKRNNHTLTFNGETLCVLEWSRRSHLDYNTILRRLKRGLTDEQALTTPSRKTGKCLSSG